MNGRGYRRLVLLLIGLVAVVGVLAYNAGIGANGNGNAVVMPFGPMRMYRGYGWPGYGLFGFLGFLAIGVLIVWLVVALVSGPRGGHRPLDPSSVDLSAGGGVDRLRELTELHDKGALTDEEFTAAKRKLLGL
jgi:uncharacterized membrane protein